MAQRFHAERYLRLLGERDLTRDRWDRPGELPLAAAAEALVAIRAIDAAVARRVVADYARAMSLREPHGRVWESPSDEPLGEPVEFAPPRVVACDRPVECSWGSLHVKYVVFAENVLTLGVGGRYSPGSAASRTRSRPAPRWLPRMAGPHAPPSMPPTITVGDDRGTSAGAHFSGGSSSDGFDGTYTADGRLARDTAWIEVDGTRIELADEPAAVTVRVEDHGAGADPAPAYLRHRVATADLRFMQQGDTIEAAIDALVAAGALEPDDPVIDEIRGVVAAMHGRPGRYRPYPQPPQPARGGGLAEPWASVLNHPPRQAPRGFVAIGAVTPVFDGVRIAAHVLASEAECFRVAAQMSPALESPRPGRAHLANRKLAWWAADDRGNGYLGHLEGWSSHGSDRAECRLVFTPALDPKATGLDLIPTTLAARAIISIPLPDWSGPS